MKKYRFKKVLLVIACFSLVVVMTARGSGSSGGGSHASISTDPDNPSELTFPETNEDGDIFYQSIYNSTVDDPDAEPGTIYGCYQGTSTDGDIIAFVASKPQLSDTITQKLDENGLNISLLAQYKAKLTTPTHMIKFTYSKMRLHTMLFRVTKKPLKLSVDISALA